MGRFSSAVANVALGFEPPSQGQVGKGEALLQGGGALGPGAKFSRIVPTVVDVGIQDVAPGSRPPNADLVTQSRDSTTIRSALPPSRHVT